MRSCSEKEKKEKKLAYANEESNRACDDFVIVMI